MDLHSNLWRRNCICNRISCKLFVGSACTVVISSLAEISKSMLNMKFKFQVDGIGRWSNGDFSGEKPEYMSRNGLGMDLFSSFAAILRH
ncbi:hypothetical protein K1719_033201 [Acacia pycnantha]|nr:hypothetical protein K1719_033201 [Acacia pycnantha]